MAGSMDTGSSSPLLSSSRCSSSPNGSNRRSPSPRPHTRHKGRNVGGLLLMAMMLLALLALQVPAIGAIQFDVGPYVTRVSSKKGRSVLALQFLHKPDHDTAITTYHPHTHTCLHTCTQCIMDEYAPEEESALKLRAVGRVQEGVKATVRACLAFAIPLGTSELESMALHHAPPRTNNIKVSDPEAQTVWEGSLTAAEQEVPLPEEEYGLYQICIYNGGKCVRVCTVFIVMCGHAGCDKCVLARRQNRSLPSD